MKYFVIEAKNEAITETICKHDCNQLNGSIIWFKEKYDSTCFATPILTHPSNIFEYAASPDPDTRIINSEKLEELKKALLNFIKTSADSNNFRNPTKLSQILNQFNLTPENFIRYYTVNYKVKQR